MESEVREVMGVFFSLSSLPGMLPANLLNLEEIRGSDPGMIERRAPAPHSTTFGTMKNESSWAGALPVTFAG